MHLIGNGVDFADAVAARLVDAHRARLPDFTHLTLLVPTPALIAPLAARLVRHAGGALLGPRILTLEAFAAERGREAPALSALECRLQLAQSLRAHRNLFPGQDPWTLADALFSLLEDLSANAAELALDRTRFVERVTAAYGRRLGALSDEAQIVHLLWTAFLEQTRRRSPAVADLDDLRVALARIGAGESVHALGFDALPRGQAAVLREALAAGKLTVWLHGRTAGRDGRALQSFLRALGQVAPAPAPSADFLDRLFDPDEAPLAARIAGLAPPPLRLASGSGPEHEARMVEVAVRGFLLDGCRDVAVVTQDRRLARRLRALLERAGVPLRDEVGWALSTSRAAASLLAWLDCCAQDFNHRPLLELLKSGYFDDDAPTVDGLERSVWRHGGGDGSSLLPLLPVALASRLRNAARRAAGGDPVTGLVDSLGELGLWARWRDDAAGRRLVEELERLQAALRRTGLRLDRDELRTVLGRVLEQALFMPEQARGPVRLLTLDQARGLSCEALVVAGAGAGSWPGAPPPLPVFNHAVRAELGLPHWRERHDLLLQRFRILLQAAPRAVLTWSPEKEGEAARPSPWIDLLLAAAPGLRDTSLARLAAMPATELATTSTPPAPVAAPRPPAVAALLPPSLSAAAHQALVDCPYRFHASACLGLAAPEDPDQPASRKDYGERVHAILAAFEQAQDGLPPPFGRPVLEGDRDAAAARLAQIAEAVFAPDLAQRFLARIWLDEFRALIPGLVEWLIARGGEFPHVSAEAKRERELAAGLAIHGRIDRLETSGGGEHRVVDYKTGDAPAAEQVARGEAVQPTHYALLVGNCVAVEYLQLRRAQREARLTSTVVEGMDLAEASAGVAMRLRSLVGAVHGGQALPAHGDALTCSRCDFAGLCRRGAWGEA